MTSVNYFPLSTIFSEGGVSGRVSMSTVRCASQPDSFFTSSNMNSWSHDLNGHSSSSCDSDSLHSESSPDKQSVKLAELKRKNKAYKTLVGELRSQHQSQLAEIIEFKSMTNSYELLVGELQGELRQLQSEYTRLQKDNDSQQLMINKLTQQLQSTESEFAECDRRLVATRVEAEQNKLQSETYSATISQLEMQNRNWSLKFQALLDEYNDEIRLGKEERAELETNIAQAEQETLYVSRKLKSSSRSRSSCSICSAHFR